MIRALFAIAFTLLLAACDPRVTTLGALQRDAQSDAETATDAASATDAATATDARTDAAPASTGRYLEAEDGMLAGGFTREADARASGGHAIAPPAGVISSDQPGTARASYRFEIATNATYVIWGRIHSPDVDHNRFWFQLDGGDWHKWRISTGDIWYWDALHENAQYDHALEFALEAGEHELVIANWVDGVGLDRLYVTADGDEPPGNDTPCNPPHSIEVDGACQPSCGSHLETTCSAVDCAGQALLPAYDCAICCKTAP
jgi:hypothetical protein